MSDDVEPTPNVGKDWDSNLVTKPPEPKYKVFVINLERSKARWASMCRQFQAQGFTNFEKWVATDAQTLDQHPDRKLIDKDVWNKAKLGGRRYHFDHNMGSLGCYLSHIHLWEHIASSDLDFGIVIEDDARVCRDFHDRILEICAEAPPEWQHIGIGIAISPSFTHY
jgi:GR25 family glycosyltransferase involved in LPS biosynthesis